MNAMKVGCMLLVAAQSVIAANWTQWRGPFFNGSSDEKGLPTSWTKTENVAWSATLPGSGAATPVIWEDYVFISSTDRETRTLQALCFQRSTGKLLWQHKVAEGYQRDNRSNFAAPSPVTDGQRVIFFYGNGPLAAFSLKGDKLWERNIGKDYGDFAFLWTFSTSPLLYQGKLYLQVLQRDEPVGGRGRVENGTIESYLLAMDPANGKTLWRSMRPSEAKAESREAFSTPIPFEHEGRAELLVVGGDYISGHNPQNGEMLWSWGTWNPTRIGHWRLVPSPVAGGGVILACGPKQAPIYAVKAGGKGKLDDSDLAWTSRENPLVTSDVPTPLFYNGDFFVLSDLKKTLSRVEPATGKVKWSVPTPGSSKFESSPTGADEKLYFINFRGEVVVAAAQDGKILRTIAMGESGDDMIRSSIAVAHGQLFIRTNQKLYCIGSAKAK